MATNCEIYWFMATILSAKYSESLNLSKIHWKQSKVSKAIIPNPVEIFGKKPRKQVKNMVKMLNKEECGDLGCIVRVTGVRDIFVRHSWTSSTKSLDFVEVVKLWFGWRIPVFQMLSSWRNRIWKRHAKFS